MTYESPSSIFDGPDRLESIIKKSAKSMALADSDLKDTDSTQEKVSDIHVDELEKGKVDL